MRRGDLREPHEDLDTRIFREHWNYRYKETKQDVQRKMDAILKKASNK